MTICDCGTPMRPLKKLDKDNKWYVSHYYCKTCNQTVEVY